MVRSFRSSGTGTIKARILAIALIPSIALLIVGAGVSGYLVSHGLSVHQFSDEVRATLGPTKGFIESIQEERRLSVLRLSTNETSRSELEAQRHYVDLALKELLSAQSKLADSGPEDVRTAYDDFERGASGLSLMRQRIDGNSTEPFEVYDFYSELVELVGAGIQGIARSGTEAEIAFEQMIGYDLFRSVEAQSRSHVLVGLAMSQGLDPKKYHELAHQMGTYHELIETVVSQLTPSEQRTYEQLQSTEAWATLTGGDNAIMALGPGKHTPNFDVIQWRAAAQELSQALLGLYASHSALAADLGASSGSAFLISSLIAGAVILLVALVAMTIALRLSRRIIGRLTRLTEETLALSEEELPNVVERLRQGDRIDVGDQVPWLDHGDDEIGQVANAFNKAQRTAISAAVQEAETRKGVGAVFLNIAHRTQVIVHRQLKVLDKVERSEDDPDQLQLLFQLDHLATRSRRNAENLIILGGEQPGRQWRNPVSLREVVRSAIAETEHYTRVVTSMVPDTLMDGSVVADLAHLLAELVDNATAFSPPQARVEVRGNVVGRGVVVEIEDQGLGIDAEQLRKLNETLRKPPDFSVMALSTESRVGLFVVARLALRHGIRITLRESVYGGTTAVVLIPSTVIAQESTPHEIPAMVSIGSTQADGFFVDNLPAPRRNEPAPTPTEQPAIGSSWTTVVFDQPDQARPAEPAAPVRAEGANTNGTATSSPKTNGAKTNGTATNGTATNARTPVATHAKAAKPPLPRRQRQANIAPQLKDPVETPDDVDGEELGDAQRARTVMAAFQQGTQRARTTDAEPGASLNGHR